MICRAEVLPGVSFVSGSPAEAKDSDPLTAAGSLTASVTTKLSAVAPEASLQDLASPGATLGMLV